MKKFGEKTRETEPKKTEIFKLLFSTGSDSTTTRAKPTTLARFSLSFPSTVGECDRFVSIRVPSGQYFSAKLAKNFKSQKPIVLDKKITSAESV